MPMLNRVVDIEKTWKTLLGIVASLFLVVSFAMLILDTKYFAGIQYLITSLLFFYTIYLVHKKKIDLKKTAAHVSFAPGFIVLIVGLNFNSASMYVGFLIWVIGIVSFLLALLKNK